jgi:transcriptional regulator with XRE-family HTH domain
MNKRPKASAGPEDVIASVLRDVRREKGLSQESLASEAGLHRTHIGLVERGKRSPTVKTLLVIAGALGLSGSALFDRFADALQEVGE